MALGAALATSVGGCDVERSGPSPASRVEAEQPAPPRTVVSLAPSLTELVFALGAGDRLIGVTRHCTHPPQALLVPKIGAYGSPSVETVVALEPDLVLTPVEGGFRAAVEQMRSVGVRVGEVPVTSLEELFDACELTGRLLGLDKAGRDLAHRLRDRVATVVDTVATLRRPKVLILVDHAPTVAAGGGTFLDGLLTAAGATNAADGTTGAWPQLSAEAVLALAPEVIVDLSMTGGDASAGGGSVPPAVAGLRHCAVVRLDPDLLVRPGPRLVDGLEALARAFHPDALGTHDRRAARAAPGGRASEVPPPAASTRESP